MGRTSLLVFSMVAMLVGVALATCLWIYRVSSGSLVGVFGWIASSVLMVLGGITMYFWLTSGEHGELKDTYELLGGKVLCKSTGLARHKCLVREGAINLHLSDFIRVAAEHFRESAGYAVRDLAETYAILTKGGMFSREKSVVLLIYVSEEGVVLEYRVAPLQATGLLDLKTFVKEVEALFDKLKNIEGG